MVTGWTRWQYEDEGPPYLKFSKSICKLNRPHPKFYTKQELEDKSEEEIKKLYDKSHKE